jgi:outer membrane immunogenic protein
MKNHLLPALWLMTFVVHATAQDWAGGYIGGNAGYSWGSAHTDIAGPTAFASVAGLQSSNLLASNTTSFRQSIVGPTGGAQIGYNFQFARLVAGAEVDFQGAWQHGGAQIADRISGTACALPIIGPPPVCVAPGPLTGMADIHIRTALSWFGTARARLGYDVNNLLIYATGGAAYGRVNIRTTLQGSAAFFSNSFDGWAFNQANLDKIGFTLGGGIEGLIPNSRWRWRIEYLYVDFGSIKDETAFRLASSQQVVIRDIVGTIPIETRLTHNLVRIGLSYALKP